MTEGNDRDLLSMIDSSDDGVSVLGLALREMPDGETTTTAHIEVNREDFANISIAPQVLTNHLISAIDSGFHENVRNYVRTRVSHRTISCICNDAACETSVAIDIVGVRQIDKSNGGWRRGFSPIVFMNNEQPLDCLTALSVDLSLIDIEGCDRVNCTNSTRCPEQREILKLARQPLFIENCINGSLENLRILDSTTGTVIGRALTPKELLPTHKDPYQTVPQYFLGNPSSLTVALVSDPLVNGIFGALMPGEFTERDPASEAEVHEAIRVLMSYSTERLLLSTKRPSERFNSSRLQVDSELYRNLVDGIPESSPVPELLTGVVLLSATACALGYTIGELTCKGLATNSLPWYHRFLLSPAFWGAFLAYGVEFTAFCLRWGDEREQNAYAESMLRYEVVGGGYHGGLAPLRVGRKTNPFTVNAYMAEVSDASRNYEPIFAMGVVAMVVSFGIAARTAWNRNMPPKDHSGEDSGETASATSTNGQPDPVSSASSSSTNAVITATSVMSMEA